MFHKDLPSQPRFCAQSSLVRDCARDLADRAGSVEALSQEEMPHGLTSEGGRRSFLSRGELRMLRGGDLVKRDT